MQLGFKVFLVIGILIIVSAALILIYYPKSNVYNESFEEDFGGMTGDADVPQDPNNPRNPVAWNISRVTYLSHSGRYSVQFYVDGRQDDGTIWIEKRIAVKNHSQIQVKLSFELYSETESFNVIAGVCAYVGIDDPEAEEDFLVLGYANEIAGWKRYTYRTNLETGSSGELWIALGITVLWETEMTYNVDDLEVTIS